MNDTLNQPSQLHVLEQSANSLSPVTTVVTDATGLPFRLTLTIQVDTLPTPSKVIPEDKNLSEEVDTEAPAINYSDRKGYDPTFLGADHIVHLPALSSTLLRDAARLISTSGQDEVELKYTHFSVIMNRQRKMPFLTAVNINGRRLRRIPRGDNWIKDSRIAQQAQFGNELYANNDLDRGHVVRRLDPVWGSDAEATLANNDTFHYTNACPQHKDFNQRTWNDLEDYILDNAGAHDLKVSVFTGPVFRADDRPYRTAKLPREFWKVAVLVDEATGNLSATAYLLSQAAMI